MAETWNKRQREKKKREMKREKAEKRSTRKENKGSSSLESMIAYVDEDGNLTSTKPEPKAIPKKPDTTRRGPDSRDYRSNYGTGS